MCIRDSPDTLQRVPHPPQSHVERLLSDAITTNPERYGAIKQFQDGAFHTTTGVQLSLDWPTLSITQVGKDTRLIRTLYRIHYLEWFGDKRSDLVLGIAGLLLLSGLVAYGLLSYIQARKP